MTRFVRAALAGGLMAAVGACADKSGRYDLSGAVTFDGKPVPAGLVVINPDLSKQNDGPQGMAEIKAGRFDTRASAKGAPAGAVVLVIDGFDGVPLPDQPQGKPLFVGHRVALDLPKAATEQAIEVPAAAGASAKKFAGPPP
jgi:hypothetical protein